MKKIGIVVLVTVLASVATIAGYELLGLNKQEVIIQTSAQPAARYVSAEPIANRSNQNLDFTFAAERTTPTVVHITSTIVQTYQAYDPFKDFFGDDFFRHFPSPQQSPRERRSQSSGSGVIISEDGYIVTNNHVVAGADDIKISLNNKETYTAELIGTDPSTDLALIKIDADGLEYLEMGNSDNVRVGEWVLAVGNPFNLESTVTAGIISATGRNINILKEQYSIESFIQTDAAVNPGNSGGALVNTDGQLVGINTAIATPTGTYAGYSFAVPVNIVRKVTEDIKKYGIVQRGFLGVIIKDVNGDLADELDLDISTGVYVEELADGGAAAEYGIKEGDVIVEIDGRNIKSSPELQESIGSKRPGDKVAVTVNRKGKNKTLSVTLRNKDGEAKIIEKNELPSTLALGIELESLSSEELTKYDVKQGVKVTEIKNGSIRKHTKMRDGFVITAIDGKAMKTPDDINDFFKKKKDGAVMIEGFYPGTPGKTYYGFGLD